MYTREEFEALRLTWAREMAQDKKLKEDAVSVLNRGDSHHWIHQGNWLGEPLLQVPQDMFALQEIIYNTRPKFVIEIGVAWAGSSLFYATLLEVLEGEKVIGVDVYIPDDLRERIRSKGRVSERIHLINRSSTAPETVAEVKALVGDCRQNFVVLDSLHTHDQVLAELRAYSPLIGKGCYVVVCDTMVADMTDHGHRPRPWGPDNNPRTALKAFFAENDRFAVDEYFDNKLLLTCNTGGYLKCIKD